MVFQSYALYPHMTVRKNIESPLTTRAAGNVGSDERVERVRAAAAMLGLEPYLDRKPGALSGGPRQRVALARAIVRRPRVVLMDEPLSNLDAKLRTQTRLELVEMWRRLGTTFIYVTHDQVEAMTMGSRIAVLADGRQQQVGPPQDVYDRPANTFVAGFIGSPPMNMLDGKAVGPGVIETAAGQLHLGTPGTSTVPVSPGDGVTVGIRPEHLHLGGAGLSGSVVNVEMLGHERHVIVSVGEALWTVRDAATDSNLSAGDAVTLGVDADRVHLFSAGDGRRLER
jgi:ABC-type sugar transport system ATPase subunit